MDHPRYVYVQCERNDSLVESPRSGSNDGYPEQLSCRSPINANGMMLDQDMIHRNKRHRTEGTPQVH